MKPFLDILQNCLGLDRSSVQFMTRAQCQSMSKPMRGEYEQQISSEGDMVVPLAARRVGSGRFRLGWRRG